MRLLAIMLLLSLTAAGDDRPVAITLAARHGAAATPHALATQAALTILRAGGTATDAAISAQMVTAMLLPHLSGPGGGGVALAYDPAARTVTSWDGREAAPALTPADGLEMAGGRAVGVPGLMPMLEALYRRGGRLPWADLFAPAIQLAEQGIPVTAQLAGAIEANRRALLQPAARALFLPGGVARAAGDVVTNPAAAELLRLIAAGGSSGLMRGTVAAEIATVVRAGDHGGLVTTDDLAAYATSGVAAPCVAYDGQTACATGPPSHGGAVLLDALTRLVPGAAVDDMARLAAIQAAIGAGPVSGGSGDASTDRAMVTLAVADADGGVVCITSGLGPVFGSRMVVHGVVLNAALEAVPAAALAATPGLRPGSFRTAVMLLDQDGALVAGGGTTQGAGSPSVLLRLLTGLAAGETPRQAVAAPHAVAIGRRVMLEADTPAAELAAGLVQRGDAVTILPLPTATMLIVEAADGTAAVADPRSEGVGALQ